jgi:sortase A
MTVIKHRPLSLCLYIFITIGALCLCYWASAAVRGGLFQARESRRFNEDVKAGPTSCRSTTKAQGPAEGSTVARLRITDLGVALIVVEGVSQQDLTLGPGHIPGTAAPGGPGNVGIAGHRDTVFRPLRLVRKGQIISLATLRGEDRYLVVSTAVVDPSDTQVLRSTGRDIVTLVTCYPFDFVGRAPKRFIVQAERVP